MQTTLPADFQVTDDHRAYCTERWNHPYLADVFLEDFRECFEDNGRKHMDWNKTFKNYIRRSSPNGPFYSAHYWQTKMEAARRMEVKDKRVREPVPYHPRELVAPVKIERAYDTGLAALRKLREQAGV